MKRAADYVDARLGVGFIVYFEDKRRVCEVSIVVL